MTADIGRLGTILSVWAHPDDETFLAGGVMAAAVRHGSRVVCVSATAGEHGTDDADEWPPDRLGRVRRWEAAAAMAVLGVDDHRWLGFEDGTLDTIDDEDGVAAVTGLIDDVRPDTVLSFGADGMTFHPDHIAVHRWVTEACRRRHSSEAAPRLLTAAVEHDHYGRFRTRLEDWSIYMTDDRPTPVDRGDLALHHELGCDDLDRKLAALHAMHSQITPVLRLMSPVEFRTLYSQESFVAVDPFRETSR
jgi:LmbE family N-acetylglucosaminyl deacetylase